MSGTAFLKRRRLTESAGEENADAHNAPDDNPRRPLPPHRAKAGCAGKLPPLRAAAVCAALALLSFAAASCDDDLISAPEPNTDRNLADAPDTPDGLTATHGGYRSVTLQWREVSGAARYLIYAAASPFDEFTLHAETKGEARLSVTEPAGVMLYFKVSAVSAAGAESPMSGEVCGSTLAVPVITKIDTAPDDPESAVVCWIMENCTADTYLDDVTSVISYSGGGAEDSVDVSKDDIGRCTVTGLSPNTTYTFTVSAACFLSAPWETSAEKKQKTPAAAENSGADE